MSAHTFDFNETEKSNICCTQVQLLGHKFVADRLECIAAYSNPQTCIILLHQYHLFTFLLRFTSSRLFCVSCFMGAHTARDYRETNCRPSAARLYFVFHYCLVNYKIKMLAVILFGNFTELVFTEFLFSCFYFYRYILFYNFHLTLFFFFIIC